MKLIPLRETLSFSHSSVQCHVPRTKMFNLLHAALKVSILGLGSEKLQAVSAQHTLQPDSDPVFFLTLTSISKESKQRKKCTSLT